MSYPAEAEGSQRNNHRAARGRSLQAVPAVLGRESLAVFRSFDMDQLSGAAAAARLALGSLMGSARGEIDHSAAVSLLELSEPAKQRALGRVPVRQAIDTVYTEVVSLRRGKTIRPTGIALMSRKKQHAKSLAVTFSAEDTEELLEERAGILRSLESLADRPLMYEFDWLRNKIPHASLGKIAMGRADEVTADMVQPILDALPKEIRIGKGSIHSPVAKKYPSSIGYLKNRAFRPVDNIQ